MNVNRAFTHKKTSIATRFVRDFLYTAKKLLKNKQKKMQQIALSFVENQHINLV